MNENHLLDSHRPESLSSRSSDSREVKFHEDVTSFEFDSFPEQDEFESVQNEFEVGDEDSQGSEEEDEDDEQAKLDQLRSSGQVLDKVAEIFQKFKMKDPDPKTIKMREKVDMSKFEKPPIEEYGLDMRTLKAWSQQRMQKLLTEEASQQEVALSKVRDFMEAITKLVKIQSWWRMMSWKKTFNEYRNGRLSIKRLFFGGWKRHVIIERKYHFCKVGKPFVAWANEVQDTKRLNSVVATFFRSCINKLKLTPQAVMCFFSPEMFGTSLSEIDVSKLRRLILSTLFGGWVVEVRAQKNLRYRASMILSRMMRKSKGPLWSKEVSLLYFHMWRRFIAVEIAFRNGEPDPVFSTP